MARRLYQKYADDLEAMIDRGALRPGNRLPSVRSASAARGVSPATVFEAYYLLEARGRIHSRPRSGYFVNEPLRAAPRVAPRPVAREHVAVNDLVFEVLGAIRERDVAPLGSAFPSPELFPLPRLARALSAGMRKLPPARIVQDLSPGNARLRAQIRVRYGVAGTEVSDREIVITNGAMEALHLALQTVTKPGDLVAIESPAFYGALQAIERLRLRALPLRTDARHGLDLGALARALRRHKVKACWVMTNFQNPLGCTMPENKKRELVRLLEQHDVPLIEDDVYAELWFGTHAPRSAKSFDTKGIVLHCGSFSKCLAPGYRVGWVAAGRYAQQIERAKLMVNLSAAVPSQQAIAEYLARGGYERHLRQLRATLRRQRDIALRAATRLLPAGTQLSNPDGGYFLWAELPRGVDALRLHRAALEEGVSIAPGHLFSPGREYAHCMRINYGYSRDVRFEPAVRRLGELARAQLD